MAMRRLKRDKATPKFVPTYFAESVLDIDFEELAKLGVCCVAFDADSTLVHFRGKALSEEIKRFLSSKRHLFEEWCIASNRVTNDLQPLADSMNARVIRATAFTRKPQKRFFKRVLTKLDARPKQVAMIGDKLIADVWGANRVGMVTVWVVRTGKDSLWDRALKTRTIEKRLIKAYLSPST